MAVTEDGIEYWIIATTKTTSNYPTWLMEWKSKEKLPATEIAKSASKENPPKVETSGPTRERHPYCS